MKSLTLLLVGLDNMHLWQLARRIEDDYGGEASIYEASCAQEAVPLLEQIMVDGIVVVEADNDGDWAHFFRRWMRRRKDLRGIPCSGTQGGVDVQAVRHAIDRCLASR